MSSKFLTFSLRLAVVIASTLTHSLSASAKVKVVTSVPELAFAASVIGGDLVETKALLSGHENPHFVDAVPEFTRLAAEADVVCIVGLDLEVGYMPAVLSRSGNSKVQPGGMGYCETGRAVTALDKPRGPIDRSMGDVHPSGNPHFYLSPKALAESASEIAAALSRVDQAHAAAYQKGLATLVANMTTLHNEVTSILEPIKGLEKAAPQKGVVIEYHREFAYFLQGYGLTAYGSIEEKPGVPPSAGRLAEVALAAKGAGVKVVLAADYYPKKTLERFAELSSIPLAIVPTMMQGSNKGTSYADLQKQIASTLVNKATAKVQGH